VKQLAVYISREQEQLAEIEFYIELWLYSRSSCRMLLLYPPVRWPPSPGRIELKDREISPDLPKDL
jgi:hypothetical protein